MRQMFAVGTEYNQIFWSVVIRHAIYVVHHFLRKKKSAKNLFHHKAVLPNVLLLTEISAVGFGGITLGSLNAGWMFRAPNFHVAPVPQRPSAFPFRMPRAFSRSCALAFYTMFPAHFINGFRGYTLVNFRLHLIGNHLLSFPAGNQLPDQINRIGYLVMMRHL